MEKAPFQFGLKAVFVAMTAAALACCVVYLFPGLSKLSSA
jgi:hypothetical protein